MKVTTKYIAYAHTRWLFFASSWDERIGCLMYLVDGSTQRVPTLTTTLWAILINDTLRAVTPLFSALISRVTHLQWLTYVAAAARNCNIVSLLLATSFHDRLPQYQSAITPTIPADNCRLFPVDDVIFCVEVIRGKRIIGRESDRTTRRIAESVKIRQEGRPWRRE